MYQITRETYGFNHSSVTTSYETWEEAIKAYKEFNNSFVQADWTRHPSSDTEIAHMDKRYNLFNEGALVLTPFFTK